MSESHAFRTWAFLACLTLAACASEPRAGGASAAERAIAITDVSIVDVERGRLVPGQTVVIRDSTIVDAGPASGVEVPPGAEVIDGRGKFLAPGFADMHVHLHTEGDLFTYVANGITTVRNMAGDSSHLRMRRRVADGSIVGPRIVTAGPVVEAAPLSHPDNVLLEDPAKVRAELARQRALGFDFVKVYNALSRPVYDSVTAIGAALGLPVAGHVPDAVGLDRALEARQRSIEHFRGYVSALQPARSPLQGGASFRDRSLAWNRIDTSRIPALVRQTVAAETWNVPTFAFTVHELSPAADHARLLARAETAVLSLAGLPSDRATTGYLRGFSDADYAAAQRGLAMQFLLLRALDSAGAGLLVGTDSWLGGFAFADELALLVRAGLSPAQVLRMATHDAARFLGEAGRAGTVAWRKRADLVLLDADPLADVGNVRRVHAVIANGRLLRREAIDARLGALRDSLARARADSTR